MVIHKKIILLTTTIVKVYMFGTHSRKKRLKIVYGFTHKFLSPVPAGWWVHLVKKPYGTL